jgi:hypothetical protein
MAPKLSCPSGHTLVNGMCQEESGIQGFGDSMNIPPSVNQNLNPAETMPDQQTPPPPQMPENKASLKNLISDVTSKVSAELPSLNIPQQMGMPFSPQRMMPLPSSPMMGMNITRPSSPQRMMPPPPSQMNIARPSSPQRMMPPPPPSPMMGMNIARPSSPQRMLGVPPTSGGGECPFGYQLNKMDNLCYPL